MGKMINRIPGLRLLISNLPGLALRMLVELLSKPCNVNKHSKSLAWYTWYQKTLTKYSLFLCLKGGCTGSSESRLVKISHCWKSHVEAQLCLSQHKRFWYFLHCQTGLQISVCIWKLFFVFFNQNICCGYSKDSMSTNNTCLNLLVRNKQFYAQKFCLTGSMVKQGRLRHVINTGPVEQNFWA